MKRTLLLRLAALLAVLTVSITANAQVWLGAQLGSPAHQGSVITNGDNTLTVEAGGNDIWNASDNGYYYYTWAQGNFDAKVNVHSLVNSSAYGGNTWSKTEMMVRWSDPAVGVQGSDAFIAAMCAPGQNQNASQYRAARAAGANNAGGAATPAVTFPNNWVRVTRTNNIFTMWSSGNGTDWTVLQAIDVSQTANGFGTPWPNLVTIGVAVTAHDDGNSAANFTTANFDKPILSTTGTGWSPPSSASIVTDVANVNTYNGSEASFKFKANNNAAPVTFPMAYQWYRDGAVVAGVTGSAYTWLAKTADAGTQVKCVAWPVGYPSVTVTSAVGTLAVSTGTVYYTNALKMEIFAGATRNGAEIGNTGSGDTGNYSQAGKLHWRSSWEDSGGWGDNTARRLTGYFIPWASGNYTFYVASDDDTDVFVSTDSDPANKRMVAQELNWSGMNNWVYSGDGTAAYSDPTNQWVNNQKCSDTWTNGSGTAPWASGLAMTAGTKYYVEVVEHNGGGGDNTSLTAKLFTDAAPTNGQPSTLTTASNDVAVITWPITTLNFTNTAAGAVQPVNTAGNQGGSVTFTARAATDAEFQPNYQWQRYGTNVPGATRTTFNINPVALTDNGMTLACVATLPGMPPVTSATATLNVIQAIFEPGFVLEERWDGVQNVDGAHNNTLGNTTYHAAIPALEASVNNETGDNYTRKISGYLVPATTGAYDFYTCSDDASVLYLSTTSDPANSREIARETSWSGAYNWTGSDGGGNVAYKNSATWTNNGTTVAPYASGISLTAGTKYWIEVDHAEGGGGDNVETAMRPHGSPVVNGTDYAPSGNLIGIYAPQVSYVAFTLQPTNPAPVGAGSTATASFYAFGVTDSQIPVGSTSANGPNNTEVANQFVFFQWYRGGTKIAGATGSQYTLTGLHPSDNGAVFMCQMRALGYGVAPSTLLWSNSQSATLTVTNDPTVPSITGGGYYNDFLSLPHISLTFNVPLDPTGVTNPANYSISGGASVQSVWISPDFKRVVLALDFAPTYPATVTLSGMQTWSGVALSGANASFSVSQTLPSGMSFADIGSVNSTTFYNDPILPSQLWIEGTNAWTIAAEGSDIWNAADGFAYLYEQKTGNFDVAVRVKQNTPTSPWAKVGLMVREPVGPGQVDDRYSLVAGGARNWNAVVDPAAVQTVDNGTGVNTTECNWRPSTYSNSTSWANAPGSVTFPQHAPAYPNAWLRMKRAGQILTAYYGTDGANWSKIGEMDVSTNNAGYFWTNSVTMTNDYLPATPLPSDVYVGLCVTAHNNDSDPLVANPRFYNFASLDHYISNYVAPPPSPVVTATLSGGNITVSWTPTGVGTLQSSPDLVTWTDVGTANPSAPIPATGKMFFRVRVPFP